MRNSLKGRRAQLRERKARGGRGLRDGRLILEVVFLRDLGDSFAAIGREVGRSRERVGAIWRRHLAEKGGGA